MTDSSLDKISKLDNQEEYTLCTALVLRLGGGEDAGDVALVILEILRELGWMSATESYDAIISDRKSGVERVVDKIDNTHDRIDSLTDQISEFDESLGQVGVSVEELAKNISKLIEAYEEDKKPKSKPSPNYYGGGWMPIGSNPNVSSSGTWTTQRSSTPPTNRIGINSVTSGMTDAQTQAALNRYTRWLASRDEN